MRIRAGGFLASRRRGRQYQYGFPRDEVHSSTSAGGACGEGSNRRGGWSAAASQAVQRNVQVLIMSTSVRQISTHGILSQDRPRRGHGGERPARLHFFEKWPGPRGNYNWARG